MAEIYSVIGTVQKRLLEAFQFSYNRKNKICQKYANIWKTNPTMNDTITITYYVYKVYSFAKHIE